MYHKKKRSFGLPKSILFIFLIFMTSVYLVGMMISYKLQRETEVNLQEYNSAGVESFAVQLGQEFDEIALKMKYTLTRKYTSQLELYKEKTEFSQMYPAVKQICEGLDALEHSNDLVEWAEVYNPKLNRVITSGGSYVPISKVREELLQAYELEGSNRSFFCYQDRWYLLSGRNAFYETGDTVLIVEISRDRLKKKCGESVRTEYMYPFVVTANSVISPLEDEAGHLNIDNLEKDIESTVITRENGEETEPVETMVKGNSYVRITEKAGSYEIWAVSYVDTKGMRQELLQFPVLGIFFTVLVMVDICIFLWLLRRLITNPIQRFTKAAEEFEQGGVLALEKSKRQNDMDFLYDSFIEAGSRLKDSMEQDYNNKLAIYQAEMKYLQAQVNPHFLYNSFYHLYRMAQMEDMEGVAEMCMKLSAYYRYITRGEEETVDLEVEYQNIRDYAEIQTIRFAERILVEFAELPLEYRKCKVPRFVLQPLMENAYYHGVEQMEEGGIIRVNVGKKGAFIWIEVENNGVCKDEKLEELNRYLDDRDKTKKITALKNVKGRMELMGGSLEIGRGRLGGFSAVVKIPAENLKEKETDYADTVDC